MDEHGPIPWDELSDSAETAVVRVIRQLAAGFSGDLTLNCKDGGVMRVREVTDFSPGKRHVKAETLER